VILERANLRLYVAALAVIVVGVAARRGNVVRSTSSKLFAIVLFAERDGIHQIPESFITAKSIIIK